MPDDFKSFDKPAPKPAAKAVAKAGVHNYDALKAICDKAIEALAPYRADIAAKLKAEAART